MMSRVYDVVIVGGGSAGSRAGQPAERRPVDAGARARGGASRPTVGRVRADAGGADAADRQPLLRLEVRVRARAAPRRPAHLPRQGQGARRLVEHQRDDLPARQPARLRAVGRRSRHGVGGTTPTACRTSGGWRTAWRRQPTTRSAATAARSCWSAGRRRARCSAPSSRRSSRPGHRLTDDVNGYRQEGFAAFDRNVHRGRRLSAARAYLHPVMGRENLDVVTRAMVTRLVVDGDRVTGVEYTRPGRRHERVTCGEVILCGGAFNSPQLLQVSGIGDAEHLRSVGVDVRHHLPGVGRAPAGPPRGVRAARQHAAGVAEPVAAEVALAVDRHAVAGPARTGRLQPLRGRRLHPQQRRRRLPEPDVPLPADRRPLRRFRSGRRARLPGAHRADVLRLAWLGAHPIA